MNKNKNKKLRNYKKIPEKKSEEIFDFFSGIPVGILMNISEGYFEMSLWWLFERICDGCPEKFLALSLEKISKESLEEFLKTFLEDFGKNPGNIFKGIFEKFSEKWPVVSLGHFFENSEGESTPGQICRRIPGRIEEFLEQSIQCFLKELCVEIMKKCLKLPIGKDTRLDGH